MGVRGNSVAGLKRIQLWVITMACVVACSAGIRMLSFGVVHYTDARFEAESKTVAAQEPRSLEVVRAEDIAAQKAASETETHVRIRNVRAGAEGEPTPPRVTRTEHAEHAGQAEQASPVLHRSGPISGMGRTIDAVGSMASAVGIIAMLTLLIMTILGVVIAATAFVPGVERTVTACVWAIILAMLCLPWSRILPGVPLNGVFTPQDALIKASAAALGSGAGEVHIHMTYLVIPFIGVATAIAVAIWFRAGINQAVASMGTTVLDEYLERDMAAARERMSVGMTSRSAAALGNLMADNHSGSTGNEAPVRGGLRSSELDSITADEDIGSINRPRPGKGLGRII